MRYLLVLVFFLSIVTTSHALEKPAPPFRLLWEYSVNDAGDPIRASIISDNALFYATDHSYARIDLRTGKCLWKNKISNESTPVSLFLGNHILNVVMGDQALLGVNASTGREISRILLTSKARYCRSIVKNGILYYVKKNGALSALNINTATTLFEVALKALHPKGAELKDDDCMQIHISYHRLLLYSYQKNLVSVDPVTGRVLFRRTFNEYLSSTADDGERIYAKSNYDTLTVLRGKDGKLLWSFGGHGRHCSMPFSNGSLLFVSSQDGKLYALNPADGKPVWKYAVSRFKPYPQEFPISICQDSIYVLCDSILFCVDRKGSLLWKFDMKSEACQPLRIIGLPDRLIAGDDDDLYCYTQGVPPPLLSDRNARLALARSYVSRFSHLSRNEKNKLSKLAPEAFEVLLPLVKRNICEYETSVAHVTETKSEEEVEIDPYSTLHNSQYRSFLGAVWMLGRVTTTGNTAELLSLFNTSHHPFIRKEILTILIEKGDEALTTPLLIDIISKKEPGRNTPEAPLFYSALNGISHSHDPDAVQFLTDKLNNQGTARIIRNTAFINIARSGTREALQAVSAARDRERTIPTLEKYIGFEKLGLETQQWSLTDFENRLIFIRKDTVGSLWGLAQSCALGSIWDAWLIRYNGEKWISPLFTDKDIMDYDINVWFDDLVGNREIYLDSDNDGWSDLVEKRFGTDPHNADSDGDGLIDSKDKNPLAPPRVLSEREAIVQTAFGGVFWHQWEVDSTFKAPCIVELPEEMNQMEFYGWDWVTVSRESGLKHPLKSLTGRGINIIGFSAPHKDFNGHTFCKINNKQFLLWNKNRTRVRTHIWTHIGDLNARGMDVELWKWGDEWYVVSIELLWVS